MPFAYAVNATAGVGIGTFVGVALILWFMTRSGRKVELIRGSVFFTAVAAGMGAWVVAALVTSVTG